MLYQTPGPAGPPAISLSAIGQVLIQRKDPYSRYPEAETAPEMSLFKLVRVEEFQ